MKKFISLFSFHWDLEAPPQGSGKDGIGGEAPKGTKSPLAFGNYEGLYIGAQEAPPLGAGRARSLV